MPHKVLITGISGQDGSYLAEQLLQAGCEVLAYQRSPDASLGKSGHLAGYLRTCCFPADSANGWENWLAREQPDEFYHLAGMSFVPDCWADPGRCAAVNYQWTTIILEAIRKASPYTRFLYACSSEVFGKPRQWPQDESTPFEPLTPYGISKASSYWLVRAYRERYGLFASNAILFNHESPRRETKFVSRKISHGVAAIEAGHQERLSLGNLAVERDWGFAGEFVDAMHRMLNIDAPSDIVIGTGRLTSLKDLVEIAFDEAGLDWQRYVDIDPGLFRPTEAERICKMVANPSRARELLGWRAKVEPRELVRMMLDADRKLLHRADKRAA
jgi:GDPmannose 4,6-dehydratase